jgi:hypothetical protein
MNHQEIIYQEEHIIKAIFSIVLLIVLVSVYYFYVNSFGILFSIFFLLFGIASIFFDDVINHYEIHKEGIVVKKDFNPRVKYEIRYDEIDQVRYEDQSGGYYIVYLKNDVTRLNIKKGYLKFKIGGLKRKKKIIKVLKYFKSHGIDVKLKTRSKKIQKETGLFNWDLS